MAAAEKPLQSKLTAEAVGTFFLCFVGGGAICHDYLSGVPGEPGASIGLLGIAVAHGLAVAIAVSAIMRISGGHINPAVTIALAAIGKHPKGEVAPYIGAQLLGGIVAGYLLCAFYAGATGKEALEAIALGTPMLGAGVSPGLGVLVEVALTFLLVFAIFGTAIDPRAPQIGGFGIGLTVTCDILVGGPLTGAAMNPARVLGTGLPAGEWAYHWVYWVGPVAGALLAALVYVKLILPSGSTD